MRARRQPPFFCLVAGAGAVTLFAFVVAGVIAYEFIRLDKFGYAVDNRDDHIQVISVNADGPAAGGGQVARGR